MTKLLTVKETAAYLRTLTLPISFLHDKAP